MQPFEAAGPLDGPPDGLDAPAAMPVLDAVEVQDSLMIAGHDLDRLQRLLADACAALYENFNGALDALQPLESQGADAAAAVKQHLVAATIALQFQDLAWQLINHTTTRLRHCVDRIGADLLGSDDDDGHTLVEQAPLRPNPVTQDEMDAGSVELF